MAETDVMTKESCVGYINGHLHESVKRFLFKNHDRMPTFLNSVVIVMQYFPNAMNLAFAFVYGKYRKWKENGGCVTESARRANNFTRVMNLMEELYDRTSLSSELLEDVLLEIQIDAAIRGNNITDNLIDTLDLEKDILCDKQFNEYVYNASLARHTNRFGNLTLAQCRKTFIDMLDTFAFLSKIELTERPLAGVFRADENGALEPEPGFQEIGISYRHLGDKREELSLYHTLALYQGTYYYLESIRIDPDEDGVLDLCYSAVGNAARALQVAVVNQNVAKTFEPGTLVITDASGDDGLRERYIVDLDAMEIFSSLEDGDPTLIRDFFSINYKYIKRLALAIADTVNSESREKLVETYREMRPAFFVSGKAVVSWDTLTAMMLIEVGTGNVLKQLLKTQGDTAFRKLLSNLEMRIGSDLINAKAIYGDAENEINRLLRQSGKNLSPSDSKCLEREIEIDTKVNILVKKIVEAMMTNYPATELASYPISIKSRTAMLNEIFTMDLDDADKVLKVRRIVIQTLKDVLCFYEGFFAYAAKKSVFETESYYKCLTQERIDRFQHEADLAFQNAAAAASERYSGAEFDAVPELLDAVRSMCLDCQKNTENRRRVLLKEMLGRDFLLDYERLESLRPWFSSAVEEDDFDEFALAVKKAFTYLQSGKRGKTKDDGIIFPYVATYEYMNTTRDGYNIAHFTYITENGKQRDIKVLSEFTYTLDEKYFCLPHALRSINKFTGAEANLWIEPIMINCRYFVRSEENNEVS